MSQRLATLNPTEVDILYGPVPVDGFNEDEFVTIERQDDTFLGVQGVDGEYARSLNAKDMTVVSVKLLQSSKSNDLLSAMLSLDVLTGGRSPQTFLLKDRSGRTLFAAPNSWIMKPPAQPFGATAKEREWKIACVGMPPTNLIGGN